MREVRLGEPCARSRRRAATRRDGNVVRTMGADAQAQERGRARSSFVKRPSSARCCAGTTAVYIVQLYTSHTYSTQPSVDSGCPYARCCVAVAAAQCGVRGGGGRLPDSAEDSENEAVWRRPRRDWRAGWMLAQLIRVGAIATCVGLAARAPPGQAGGGLAQRTASRSGGVREACTHSGELSMTVSVSIGQEARRRQAGGYHEKGGTSKGHQRLSPAKHPEKMHASTTLLS